jgi:hypothetical protein
MKVEVYMLFHLKSKLVCWMHLQANRVHNTYAKAIIPSPSGHASIFLNIASLLSGYLNL